MNEKFRSYAVARKIFSILEFIFWCFVVLGLVTGLVMVESAGRYVSEGQKFLLFLWGASGSIVGLFLVGVVQYFRASVDGAEYAQQGLKIARDQLDVSRQLLKVQKEDRNSFAALNSADEQSVSAGFGSFDSTPAKRRDEKGSAQETEYRGEAIKLFGGSYRAIGRAFESEKAAQAAIDQKLDIPSSEIAPPIAETQPVLQPNGHDEEAPRSFAELRATKFGEVEPQADAQDMSVEQPTSLNGDKLTLDGELQDFEQPSEELETEPVRAIEIEVQPAVKETPKRPEPKIEEEDGKFIYGRLSFSSREAAEKYVSQLGVNPNFTG